MTNADYDPLETLKRVHVILKTPFFTKKGLLMVLEAARANIDGTLAYHEEVARGKK